MRLPAIKVKQRKATPDTVFDEKERGRRSLKDKTSKELRECTTVAQMIELAYKYGVDHPERITGKSTGIARMILGNMIRTARRKRK